MQLRDLPIEKAENILFDILTISTAVQTNSAELKEKIINGHSRICKEEQIKEVVFDLEGNSYGWLRSNQLKYFKSDFKIAKKFIEENF